MRSISTGTALLTLVVTLIFNTIGVWNQRDQAEQTRLATELGVLTQLNESAAASDREINATEAWDRRCDKFTVQSLRAGDEARIISALDQYDYLAFLLNRNLVTMQEAGSYWQRDMVEAYALAEAFIDPGWLDTHHVQLRRFFDRAPKSLRPTCP